MDRNSCPYGRQRRERSLAVQCAVHAGGSGSFVYFRVISAPCACCARRQRRWRHHVSQLVSWRLQRNPNDGFSLHQTKRWHRLALPDCAMDVGILESAHHDAPYFRVPCPIPLLGYAGCFIRSIARRVPAPVVCDGASSAGADATRRQNGFRVPQRVSAPGRTYIRIPDHSQVTQARRTQRGSLPRRRKWKSTRSSQRWSVHDMDRHLADAVKSELQRWHQHPSNASNGGRGTV